MANPPELTLKVNDVIALVERHKPAIASTSPADAAEPYLFIIDLFVVVFE